MVLYRLDVSIIAIARPEGTGYFPSWEEFAVSLGIVSAFALIFIFFVEHLKVYDDLWERPAPDWRPAADPTTHRGLLPARLAGPRRNTAACLVGAAVALLFLPMDGLEPIRTPTRGARNVLGTFQNTGGERVACLLAAAPAEETDGSGSKLLMMIDGNRNGDLVLFDHDTHRTNLGGQSSCGVCHHLRKPLDRTPGCYECHQDMYGSTSVFSHQSHVMSLGGNTGCPACHAEREEVKSYQTITACLACHVQEVSASPVIAPPRERWRAAPSYRDAMHHLCIACHRQELEESPESLRVSLDQCINCHDADRRDQLRELMPTRAHLALRRGVEVSLQTGPQEGE